MNVPPDSALWKNSSSVTSRGLGVVRDEDQLDRAVLGRDELVEQEEVAPGEVLLHRVHRARGVHDAHHHRVRLVAHVGDHVAVGEILGVERDAGASRRGMCGVARRVEAARVAAWWRGCAARARAPCAACRAGCGCRPGGSPLRFAVRAAAILRSALRSRSGQLEILEHDLDQLLERDVGLVEVLARLVAGLVPARACLLALADHLAGSVSPSPWPTPGALSP